MMSTRTPGHFVVAGLLLALTAESGRAQQSSAPRPLAPGVLTVIPPSEMQGETFQGPAPLVEIVEGMSDLEWTPNFDPKSNTLYEKAKHVVFRRPIWMLEFAFKPMRMIEVDVPQPTGKMQRKLIWYIVYRVRNTGYALSPSGNQDRWGQTLYEVQEVNYKTRRFFPHFVLRSIEFDKEYLDRVIPAAQEAIQRREDPGGRLYNSVEISAQPIPLSDERVKRDVWGVATWEDVDPRIDFFSVLVRGLTNAFKFEDPEGAYQAGDPPGSGREFQYKTLQLNFWRPGDPVLEHEREFRFGVPIKPDPEAQQEILDKYGLEQRLDYRWIYR